MERILIIFEESGRSFEQVLEHLLVAGFEMVAVQDGNQAVELGVSGEYDLLMLNVSHERGIEFIGKIRSRSNIPLLMMSEAVEDGGRIEALETGADDYLKNPFDPRELLARIRGILRRAKSETHGTPDPVDQEKIVVSDVELDPGIRIAYQDGRAVELTSVEFNVLEVLLKDVGRIISREELARRALGRALGMGDRSIDVHISSLRKKLGRHASGFDRIGTVRNWGYFYARLPQRLEQG